MLPSKVLSVDQQECGVGFRQLRTCRRTRAQLWADCVEKVENASQQNSRKRELIADFGWRCPLRARGKATE
jgi:hypothetical protein